MVELDPTELKIWEWYGLILYDDGKIEATCYDVATFNKVKEMRVGTYFHAFDSVAIRK